MKNYLAFTKKEIMEYARTYKMLILFMIFAVFGITNPLMAKLLPELLASLMTDSITMILPEPSSFDAWEQFFKNATQMGFLVMLILFSGVLASELTKGSLINLLTKGLSRSAVILSKYTCMVLIWTVCISLCFFLTYGYTAYLFPGGETSNLFFSALCLWMFGVFLLAALLFGAALTKSGYGCLLITGGVVATCMLLNILPGVKGYNPISLASDNMSLVTGAATASSLYGAGLTAALLSALFLWLSVLLFKKKLL